MYLIALGALVALSFFVRLIGLEVYPPGFSGHAIVHAQLRIRLYEILFNLPWNGNNLNDLYQIVFIDQHGLQSFIEALLTPIFGWGLLGSRWIALD